jgi:predicted CopG family antitoxin
MDMDEPIKKNISVKPFIHERLVNLKHGHDTFDDVIERLLNNWQEGK